MDPPPPPPLLHELEALRFDNRALCELPVRQSCGSVDETPLSLAQNACYVLLPPPPPPQQHEAPTSSSRPPPESRLRLLATSAPALQLLALDPSDAERRPDLYASALLGGGGGNDGPYSFLPGARPAAHVYGGHQFGFFAGLLGDGAALYLGEVVVGVSGRRDGETAGLGPERAGRPRRLELNVEGAGPTPLTRHGRGGCGDNSGAAVSRGSDEDIAETPTTTTTKTPPPGRKALLEAAREFCASEALAALGVPSTRSALLGHCCCPGQDPSAGFGVVLRLAPSFLRLGSLEVCRGASAATGRAGPSSSSSAAGHGGGGGSGGGPQELLPRLVDHAIRRHYPEVWRAFGGGGGDYGDDDDHEEAGVGRAGGSEEEEAPPPPPPFHLASDLEARADMVGAFLGELAAAHGRTAALWQAQGFVHGCLNSDNLSIGAETINGGNGARFLGRLDRALAPHPLDFSSAYSFGSQRGAVRFALERVAEALGSASAMAAAGIAGVGGGGGGGGATAAAAATAAVAAAAAAAAAGATATPPPPPPQHAVPLAMPGGVGPGRARRELARFDAEFDRVYLETMRRKLGLLLPLPPAVGAAPSVGGDGVGGGASGSSSAAAVAEEQGDCALVAELLDVMEATGADYSRTMRRLRLVALVAADGAAAAADNTNDDDKGTGGEASDDDFGGFLSPSFLSDDLPSPGYLANAIAASLPPERNVRALSALARRDAAFAHALGVPRESLDALLERHRACAGLRAMAAAAAGGGADGDGGRARKREEDARRWRAWLRRYARRLAAEAEAGAARLGASSAEKEAAVRRAAEARLRAMDAINPAFVLREEDLREAAAAAAGEGGGDGGRALRVLLARLQRPFEDGCDDGFLKTAC